LIHYIRITKLKQSGHMKILNSGRRSKFMKKTDVVIIGAGPAGLSAAIECKKHDVDVIVVDEFPKPGGRMLGQLHQEPNGEWWNGIKETDILMEKAEELNTTIECGIAVHHIE